MTLEGMKFSESHVWVRPDDEEIVIGITDHAQGQLGDVIFVELAEPGTEIVAGADFGSIESAKAVEDLISPLTGTVTRRNDDLTDSPETINEDPYEEALMIAIQPEAPEQLDGLLTPEEYEKYLDTLDTDSGDSSDDDDLFF